MQVPLQSDPLVRAALMAARALARYHGASLDGARHLPAGPALLVGNHGLLGLDTPVLFSLLHGASGKLPVGLADRTVFAPWPLRSLLARLGGVPGTPGNALALLAQGEHVVCYPGGSREVFKREDQRYRLQWDRADGFARVAIESGAPVIPFAGHGVDETCLHFGHSRALEFLGRYSPPLAIGPLPVRISFTLGAPLLPPPSLDGLAEFKRAVQAAVEKLLQLKARESPAALGAAAAVVP